MWLAGPVANAAGEPDAVAALGLSSQPGPDDESGYAEVLDSLRKTIKVEPGLDVYVENLPLNNFEGPRHERNLQNYLQQKYLELPIGVLVAVGSSALRFALEHGTDTWPAVPIVFAAADGQSAKKFISSAPIRRVTGRTLRFSLSAPVAIARILVPGLRSIALVGDPLERQILRRLSHEELQQAIIGLTLIDLTGLSIGEVGKRVSALPDRSAIIYTAIDDDAGVSSAQ
jgi:hypothetical protein